MSSSCQPCTKDIGMRKGHCLILAIYIGSTTTSVHSRQDARIRKLRLLQQGQFTNTELMVHYFHVHANFYDSLILPFEKYQSKTAVRVAECARIQLWKPQLNMPWIAKLNPTSATRTYVPKLGNTTYQTPGRRLWLRVRLRTLGILQLYSSTCLSPFEGWSILVAFAQGGLLNPSNSQHAQTLEIQA